MRNAVFSIILLSGLIAPAVMLTSCFSHQSSPLPDEQPIGGPRSKPPVATTGTAERTEPARTIVAHVDPRSGPSGMQFTELNAAFHALRDSNLAGSDAERYELRIGPGTYRLRKPLVWVNPEKLQRWTEIALIADGGPVTISGAMLFGDDEAGDLDRWVTIDSAQFQYRTDWPYRWGTADVSGFNANYRDWIHGTERPELLLRREMVLVNGEHLQQRLAGEPLLPGSFQVIEGQGNSPGTLTIQLGEALKPDDRIEIPVAEQLLALRNFDRVQIEGIDFIHANSFHANTAVVVSGTQGVRITDCSFNDNNWRGLSIGGVPLPVDRARPDSIELIRCRMNGNGGMGLGAPFVARMRMEDCELAWNNWRGFAAGTEAWAVGGSKFFHTHDVTVVNLHAHHNFGSGLWFDTDGERIRITDSRFVANTRDGLFVEACQGPVDVAFNQFIENGRDGLRSNSSEWLYVRKNRFVHNGVAHFGLAGLNRSFANFETDRKLTVEGNANYFYNNQFVGEPIWYVEEWLKSGGMDEYARMTTYSGNACWPYDSGNPFCQKELPEDLR